ncbi:ammonium transporter [Stieleria varia]|uniref:histidine kinase n=1 Tax=Stieleria varia TaxID=2528005 RepID=A0A5C6B6T1_9BACT|nr:ammonium transporter [Stieleria varia]TWU07668.1 Sensory/regulatory protein RpfC [Stieleria varia]
MLDSPVDLAWVLISAAMVMLMQAGFCLLESGLVRSKNTINVAMKNLANLCVSGCVFWAVGFGFMYGSSQFGLLGTSDFFPGASFAPQQVALIVFQTAFCGIAATIVAGAVAERMRFVGYLALTVVIAGALYPIFGHWAWGGLLEGSGVGFLRRLGFIDFAGSTVVHSVGGWAALATAIWIGPRLGRFGRRSDRIRGNSLPMAAVGTLILWFGWFGLTAGSTLAVTGQASSIMLNTNLGAMFGGLTSMIFSSAIQRRPVVEHSLNGIIAGLVSVTAGCHVMSPASAACCGALGGMLVTIAMYHLDRWRVDDAVGAVSAHAIAGVWGTLAVALLSNPSTWDTGLSRWEQLGVQITGVVICFIWSFGGTTLACWAINRWIVLRVSPRAECIGLNVIEHDANTELLEMSAEMDRHRRRGSFNRRVETTRFSELGGIARHYNRVLGRVEAEIAQHAETSNKLSIAESRFRGMFENAREGLFQITSKGRFLHVNDSLARIIGLESPKEVIRQIDDAAVDLLNDPADWERLTEQLDEQGDVAGFEVELQHFGGRVIWVSVNARRLPDHGDEVSYEGSIIDISDRRNNEILRQEKRRLAKLNQRLSREIQERREAESLARLSEEKFRSLFNSTSDGILILQNGELVNCNHAAAKLFGYTDSQTLLGSDLSDLFPAKQPTGETSKDLFAKYSHQALAQGSCSFDWLCVQRNGAEFPCEIVLSFADVDGDHVLQVSVHDVTERQRQLRELMVAKDAAQAASRSKSEFLANMSHEIRTPLNGILGFTEVLRRGSIEPTKQQEYLNTIHSSGHHLLTLINDVLDLTKIEAGRMEVDRRNCSPHEIMCEVMSILRVMAIEKGLDLECRWQTGVPETICTDPDRLRQLLMNLVGNAIKFTQRGHVRLLASLDQSGSQPMLKIEVKDTGIGIESSNLQRIFRPFDQADNSITRRFGGTGLGLTISQEIAQALGGDIAVESVVGVGSTFRVWIETGDLSGIPIIAGNRAEAIRSNRRQVAQRQSTTTASLSGIRILVCDDGETNRELISLVLIDAGADVVCTVNGREAVDTILHSKQVYDLILMDMQMPVLDGYSATKQLRQYGVTMPVIALTAHAMRGDREKCLDAGCTDYLRKPIDIDELLACVRYNVGLTAEMTTATETKVDSIPIAEAVDPATEGTVAETGSDLPIHSTLPTDREEFQRIVASFSEKLAGRITVMRKTAEAGDFDELASHAHWLKGAGGTMGFACFTSPAESLERFAKENQLAAAAEVLDIIESLHRRIELPWLQSV